MDRRFSNNERDGKVYTNKLRGISANSDYRMEELKKPKILSTIGSTNTKLCDQADDISDHYQDSDVRDIKSDTYKKPEAIQRNKRLFGALMGHLGVAKRKLEEDSTNIEKQSAFQMAVLQKNDLENRRLQQLQREASNSYKAKEKALREIFKLRQRRTEILASSASWNEKYVASRAHVLMTQSLPQICWLPTAHNSTTKILMEKRAEKIAVDVAEHDHLDSILTLQIDKELQSLQTYIATFSKKQIGEPSDGDGLPLNQSSIDADNILPSNLVLGLADPTDSGSGGGELFEYMARIHDRRVDNSTSDSTQNKSDTDSAINRHKWGLHQEYGPGDHWESGNHQYLQGQQQQGHQFLSSMHSGRKGMETNSFIGPPGHNGYGQGHDLNRRDIQHEQKNGRIPLNNQQQHSQSFGSISSESSRKRRDIYRSQSKSDDVAVGVEVGEELAEGARGWEGGSKGHRSDRCSDNVAEAGTEDITGEGEYNPEEAADEEERDDEEDEDEAELLLAALGGRKH